MSKEHKKSLRHKSEDLKYFILKYKLLLVVSFAGDYTNSIVFDKIHNSVTVIINSSAPKATQIFFEWFRFSYSFKRITANIGNDSVNLL